MLGFYVTFIYPRNTENTRIVSCPLFKGCHSYGETIDEALENIKEVIEMCLEEQELEPVNKFVGFRELEIVQNA